MIYRLVPGGPWSAARDPNVVAGLVNELTVRSYTPLVSRRAACG